MEFNYTSRNELFQEFQNKNQPKGILFGSENKEIFEIIMSSQWYYNESKLEKYIDKMADSRMEPGTYLRKYHRKLVEFCVTKTYLEEFYEFVKKYNQFPYSRGMGRRTVRTKEYSPSARDFFRLLGDYYRLQFFEVDLVSYLKDELTEEKLDFKNNMSYYHGMNYLDEMIAASVDSGNKKMIQAIEEIMLGENNTAVISIPIIRAIIKSSNTALHKLLGDFLLAARLQEGVRQAICENMDCGTEQAFKSLFQVIYENNLIRYASVKRAVGTWIGIQDLEHTDRIMGKVLDTMHQCIFKKEEVERCLQSQDAIEIMVALWCLGSHEVFDAVEVMRGFLKQGTRQQQLVMSYYNREIYYEKFSNEIAMKAIESYPDDLEIIAAFYPTYLVQTRAVARNAVNTVRNEKDEKVIMKELHWNRFFQSEEKAQLHFAILKGVLSQISGKKKTYAPFLFPWYRVELNRSEVIEDVCILACMLNDNDKKDFATGLLSQLEADVRSTYVQLLLYNPETPLQRETLLQMLADREAYTRKAAFRFLKEESFEEQEYDKLLEMLRFKNHEIRQNILYLLLRREDKGLERISKTMLEDQREEVRLAGLDLLLQLKKEESRNDLFVQLVPLAFSIPHPTERESILIEQLSGKEEEKKEGGFGLYTSADQSPTVSLSFQKNNYPLFQISTNQLKTLFKELDSFIQKHQEERVTDFKGEEHILGNCKSGLPRMIPWRQEADIEEKTAFLSLWKEFYHTYIKNVETLYAMYAAVLPLGNYEDLVDGGVWEEYNCKLLGDSVAKMDISGYQYGSAWKKSIADLFGQILIDLVEVYGERDYFMEISRKVCSFLINEVQPNYRWLKKHINQEECYASQSVVICLMIPLKEMWKTEEEWKERFIYIGEVDKAYDFDRLNEQNRKSYYSGRGETWLNPFDYIKAYQLNFLTLRQLYFRLFEGMDLRSTLYHIGEMIHGKKYYYIKKILENYNLLEESSDFDRKFYDLVVEIGDTITDTLLDIELKRGDTPTEVSKYISFLPPVKGSKRLRQLLVGLGKDKLVRANYTDTESKAGSFSCILRKSGPAPFETAEELKEALKDTAISRKRLIETGMFACKWLDLLEEVLEMPGLKSGTYYFMAHMDDFIDERKDSMIAKYTPLSKEELREGAFDIQWFRDVSEKLGEENITLLYDAAKYISYGSKHTRARKYADAAMGRLTVSQVKEEITEKRNKDLVMALGLIPHQGKEDLLDRYEFIRAFRKQSKEFGSMRRSNEEHAADMALKNMAIAAGYQDVTRLILVMESQLTESIQDCFCWQETPEGYQVRLELSGTGKAAMLCQKGDKILKSVPAVMKKNDKVLALKEVQKKVKEQYRRTVTMLEKAMEDRDAYTLMEFQNLLHNPVTKSIISNLVFTGREHTNGSCGFVTEKGFVDLEEQLISEEKELVLYVAHPWDLYQTGKWTAFQKRVFEWAAEEKRIQPFRQVLRELYVKLEEEQKSLSSKMFAGNQIQPSKAVACLKSRGWIADYDEGLQKIYYRDNVVARIYALADWFSPSEVEAPTLEWVEFSDRKTFQGIPVGEIPDILYSEVMRDVDLAVSVAHAGSVDPETSHSTVEMRQVIVTCNIELFGLKNVKVEGSHAVITGKKGTYNIHLGSGVIHKIGAHQINVLPVHAQSRGKLFLPFLDEDPKTAEIISKIILFSQDDKIKDPYILRQL